MADRTRRDFLKASALGGAGALAAGLVPSVSGGPIRAIRNVLLILSDDLRDTVGCYGNGAVRTPNIDRLAAAGVRFTKAYVQYPVCNPSRSSFLTGLRPQQTGVFGNRTLLRSKLPDVVTLPQHMRAHGRQAVSYGKIFHLGGGGDANLRKRWMDLPASWDAAEVFAPTPAATVIEGRNLTGGKLAWCRWASTAGGDDDLPDGLNAAAVIAAMERLGDRPWFIGAGFHKPHDPFIAPRKYFDLYPEGSLSLYRDPDGLTAAPRWAIPGGGFRESFDAFSDTERMEFQRAYYAATSYMDAQVGRVLDALDRQGLRDSTLVIFAGDNGYHHNERGWWNKDTLFERSCRVPLIVAGPGIEPGVCETPVEMVDLFPTVTDLCGVEPPPGLAGRSLRGRLEDPSRTESVPAYTLVARGGSRFGHSVTDGRYRYTEWLEGTEGIELYDHAADPEETRNLAGTPAVAEVEVRMKELLWRVPHGESAMEKTPAE